MSDRDNQSYDTLNPYRDFADDDDFSFVRELEAGEPVCAPSSGRGETLLPALFVVITISFGSFVALKMRAAWELRLQTTRTEIAAKSQQQLFSAAGPQTPAATSAEPAPAARVESHDIQDAPGSEVGTPLPAAAMASLPAASQGDGQSADRPPVEPLATGPLPPPIVDPDNRNQTRAVAAGLHPSLSPGLLTRLSTADYRNASLAISKALSETTDSEKFLWPAKPQKQLAQFEVHFVKGAPADCRRYVVTVTKDRWSTTAQPMEKCGITSPAIKGAG